jgi:hypothetical protein
MEELKEETGINFGTPTDDDIVWPAANLELALQGGKSYAVEGLDSDHLDALQEFFLDRDANDGGIGFTFVPPAGTKSSGFVLPMEDEYSGLMCILVAIDNDGVLVGCGWGPGGGK